MRTAGADSSAADGARSAALRQRGRDVPRRGLPARRRLPVRPADLRDLCQLLGSKGRFGPHRSGAEHAAQVRGIDHAHRPAMGGHDRPLRRRRGRRRRTESQAREASCKCTAAATWSAGSSTTTCSTRSSCSPIPWSSARARGYSPSPARTQHLTGRIAGTTGGGVIIQVYQPTGRPQYAHPVKG
jgi:hypothetical protein